MYQFKKKPLTERLKDTFYLLKNTFTVVPKDEDIKKPTTRMTLLTFLIITINFYAFYTFLSGNNVITGIAALLFNFFILLPFRVFFDVRNKADQSWITYNAIIGKDVSQDQAHEHTGQRKSTLRKMAGIDLAMKIAKSQQGEAKGITGVLLNLFLAALTEAWDLVIHFLMPAVIVEEKGIKEVLPRIKSLKENVPASLTGVFGIDFAGHVVSSILWPIYILFLLIGIGIGTLIPANTVTVFGFTFSWIPVLIMLYIVILAGSIVKEITESVKVIYFTIFYTSITRPQKMSADIRKEMTNYLKMEKDGGGSEINQSNSQSQVSDYTKKLANYIEYYTNEGTSEEEIHNYLLEEGYSKEDIEKAERYLERK